MSEASRQALERAYTRAEVLGQPDGRERLARAQWWLDFLKDMRATTPPGTLPADDKDALRQMAASMPEARGIVAAQQRQEAQMDAFLDQAMGMTDEQLYHADAVAAPRGFPGLLAGLQGAFQRRLVADGNDIAAKLLADTDLQARAGALLEAHKDELAAAGIDPNRYGSPVAALLEAPGLAAELERRDPSVAGIAAVAHGYRLAQANGLAEHRAAKWKPSNKDGPVLAKVKEHGEMTKVLGNPEAQREFAKWYHVTGRIPAEGLSPLEDFVQFAVAAGDGASVLNENRVPFGRRFEVDEGVELLSRFSGWEPAQVREGLARFQYADVHDGLMVRLARRDAKVRESLPKPSEADKARIEREETRRAALEARYEQVEAEKPEKPVRVYGSREAALRTAMGQQIEAHGEARTWARRFVKDHDQGPPPDVSRKGYLSRAYDALDRGADRAGATHAAVEGARPPPPPEPAEAREPSMREALEQGWRDLGGDESEPAIP